MHDLNKIKQEFKKAGGAYVTRDELEEILAPYATALHSLEDAATDHEEKITRIEGALEIDDLNAAIDELDGLADSADPTTAERPALEPDPQDPAELTSEALEGSDKEAPKKSRAKRKPEGQDPLGLVPDVEED